MKIFVAIPIYDGKLHIEFVRSLLNEQTLAVANGDWIQVSFVSGNAGIVQARNQLAHEFMESDCDRLLFLDADVTFELGALVKLAHKPADLVGGCYRYKMDDEKYPIAWLDDQEEKGLWSNEFGLIEVKSIPTGFMAISKRVLETFVEKFPDRVQSHLGHVSFTYFQMPFVDGVAYGEDFYFCKEWRDLGGKVFLDPELELTHWSFNPTPHKGHIGNWLKRQNGLPGNDQGKVE